jgi:hypothetical protein
VFVLQAARNVHQRAGMWFSFLLPQARLILDTLVAAVLPTILGPTWSFFIQAALHCLEFGTLLVMPARAGFRDLGAYLSPTFARDWCGDGAWPASSSARTAAHVA